MSFDSGEFILPAAADLIRSFVIKNDFHEILALGRVNSDGLVYDAELIAMGNDYSVPAVLKAAQPGMILIHNHPGGDIRPSNADLSVAAVAADNRVGSYIVNNDVTRVFPVVKWLPPENNVRNSVDKAAVKGVFVESGLLSQSDSSYEFRLPQLQMAEAVTDAINNEKLLAAEAGTGTGKSFAYLVPSLFYAASNEGRKVVIATSTIALEEQLMHKDIPHLLGKLSMKDLKVAILKGRSNYICLRKYDFYRIQNLQLSLDGSDKASLIEEIDIWLQLPHDGSRTMLNSAVDSEMWGDICCEESACENVRCKFYEKCYFFKARRRVNAASVILINHHLLMADVSVKREIMAEGGASSGLLPDYDLLIIDEAHNLFKSAISFLGLAESSSSLTYLLRKLFNVEKTTGIIPSLIEKLNESPITNSLEKLARDIGSFIPYFNGALIPEMGDSIKNTTNTDALEIIYELDEPELRQSIYPAFEKMIKFLSELVNVMNDLLPRLEDSYEQDTFKRSEDDDHKAVLTLRFRSIKSRLESMNDFYYRFFMDEDTKNSVFWAEKRGVKSFKFNITPIDIQGILAKYVYDKINSVIFSSATLSAGKKSGGFDFFKRESGLDRTEKDLLTAQFASCFDYEQALKIFIPYQTEPPNSALFDSETIQITEKMITASKGGALVLFTSIRHREQAAKELKNMPYKVINQKDDSIKNVVNTFRKDLSSTLLATETFWEGIDMKGDTLRNLIIIRLPFKFPSHPFIKRYIAKIEKETGVGGFLSYTLPNAVIKFKQGIGRLIRTKDDRGVLVILDNRIYTKNYGKNFHDALPENVKFSILPVAKIEEEIRLFFENR